MRQDIKTLRTMFQKGDLKAYHSLIRVVESPDRCANGRTYTEQDLFLTHKILFLFSYRFGDLEQGRASMNFLLDHSSHPLGRPHLDNVLMNSPFYSVPLSITPLHTLEPRDFLHHESMNPFLLNDEKTGGYLGGARCCKLSRNTGSRYQIFVYNAQNRIVRWFPFQPYFQYKRYGSTVSYLGLEDVRVIPSENDTYVAVCTTLNTHPEGPIRMSLFTMEFVRDPNQSILGIRTSKKITPLFGYEDQSRQKNWSPFWHHEKLCFIYSFEPLVILEAEKVRDLYTGRVHKVFEQKNQRLAKMRGGTPPLWVDHAWLIIGHYTLSRQGRYMHRLVEMTEEYQIRRVSELFYFERPAEIEFAVGMVLRNDHFYISYGIKDRIARISSIPKSSLLDKLIPIETFEAKMS